MHNSTIIWMTFFCVASLSSTIWPVLPQPRVMAAVVGTLTLFIVWRYCHQCACDYVPRKLRNSSFTINPLVICVVLHGFFSGVLWMASLGYWYLHWQPPSGTFNQIIELQLRVLQTERHSTQSGCKILAQVESKRTADQILAPKIQLYTRSDDPCPVAHSRYWARMKLKPVVAPLNPGAFDAERSAVARTLVARGTLLDLLSPPEQVNSVHAATVRLLEHVASQISGWSLALLTGDRRLLDDSHWMVLQKTGTAHLFAISGMHLSLLFGVFYVVSALLLRSGLYITRRYHLQPAYRHLAMTSAVAGCVLFAALAGWQLPVTRALVLIIVATGLMLAGIHTSGRNLAAVMLFICIVGFPFSIYSAGFYLSVGAVCSIWFCLWRFRPKLHTWSQRLRWAALLQCVLTLLMVPLTSWFFGQFSWLTIPVNLIMIPLITLLLPLGLGALVMLMVTGKPGLLLVFDQILRWIMTWLTQLADCIEPVSVHLTGPAFICWQLALILLLLPRFYWRRRGCALLCCMGLTQWLPASDKHWSVHVFDVGQGSALAISRGQHSILIDTGPVAFGEGLAAFERYVIPALAYWQISNIPVLYISHFDLDHAGGIKAAVNAFSSVRVISLLDECQQTSPVYWQGLTISILWPPPGNQVDDNNHSCVLHVTDGKWQVLIPGDIERYAEYQLLYHKLLSPVDILIAPHHGSKTSSGAAFVNAVSPETVVFTQAYNNRWQFPHSQVLMRYQKQGARILSTGNHGYIRFSMEDEQIRIETARQDLMTRWYRKPASPSP